MQLNKDDKIYVSGHTGMAGSAIVRKLRSEGFKNLLLCSRSALDLMDLAAVKKFFKEYKPDYVILAAAKVGGIQANIRQPVEFLLDNITIQNNIINQSYNNGVKKIVFLGSSCIYPKDCLQPMKEEYLLTGELEPTNEGYALAKIAGLKLLEFYKKQYGFQSLSLMPCNLYGTNDSFNIEQAHVLSSLVKKFSDAKKNHLEEVTVWGTGISRREFMHVDDLANAILYLMEHYDSSNFINVGWGKDVSIRELAEMISKEIGFEGKIYWDTTKPDGMRRKCMNVSKMKAAGFNPNISLTSGIKQTIMEYKNLSKIL